MAPPSTTEPHNPMPEPSTELTYSHLFPPSGKRSRHDTAYVPPHYRPRSHPSSMAMVPAYCGDGMLSPGFRGGKSSSQVSATMPITSKCVSHDEKSRLQAHTAVDPRVVTQCQTQN